MLMASSVGRSHVRTYARTHAMCRCCRCARQAVGLVINNLPAADSPIYSLGCAMHLMHSSNALHSRRWWGHLNKHNSWNMWTGIQIEQQCNYTRKVRCAAPRRASANKIVRDGSRSIPLRCVCVLSRCVCVRRRTQHIHIATRPVNI